MFVTEFWLLVQQSLVIGLLVLSIIYAFYVLILPLSVGGRSFDSKGLEFWSLETLMDNRITQVFGRVLERLVLFFDLVVPVSFFQIRMARIGTRNIWKGQSVLILSQVLPLEVLKIESQFIILLTMNTNISNFN